MLRPGFRFLGGTPLQVGREIRIGVELWRLFLVIEQEKKQGLQAYDVNQLGSMVAWQQLHLIGQQEKRLHHLTVSDDNPRDSIRAIDFDGSTNLGHQKLHLL